ncbi:MAG: DGQHR domain-containing protein [Desulfobacteraceae bacterium]|nr:DGQHR domain-containing protein [Desulfobacteraceae bacterium]
MSKEYIKFPCLEVKQPIGTFYIGVIDSKDLSAISFADIRRPEGRDIEKYIGTQRDLSESRVKEIKQYVTTLDACFPTSIILSIDSDNAKYNQNNNVISIRNDDKVAKIIDGQHRIAGLEEFSSQTFKLNVTIFIDMDIEDQAMVFATINLKQTKVTKSLAYDLYEYAKSSSPQKTCHNIAKLLNSKKGSPFYDRIKILGKASSDSGTQVITQSTFVDRLMRMISKDPMDDKDRIKRNRKIERYDSSRRKNFIFRRKFIENKDAEIAKTLWNYFTAVSQKWGDAWANFERGMVLARSTGFAALMRLLPDIYNDMKDRPTIIKKEQFRVYFDKCKLEDVEFTSDAFKPGSTGEGDLLRKLRRDILGT